MLKTMEDNLNLLRQMINQHQKNIMELKDQVDKNDQVNIIIQKNLEEALKVEELIDIVSFFNDQQEELITIP